METLALLGLGRDRYVCSHLAARVEERPVGCPQTIVSIRARALRGTRPLLPSTSTTVVRLTRTRWRISGVRSI